MRYLSVLLTLIAYTLTACTPANTPNELAALASVRQTQEIGIYATQAAALPITQSAQERVYSDSLTQTAIPPQLTTIAITQQAAYLLAIIESDIATRQSAANALVYSQTVASATQHASDAQARIAENNQTIANALAWSTFWRDVLQALAFILIIGFGVLIIWSISQFALYARTYRLEREKELKRRIAMRAYRETQDAVGSEFLLTSGGPMRREHPIVTLAEKHVTDYQRANNWRAVCKTYVASCIELERGGITQPFSRPKCLTHSLIQDPTTQRPWQLGHKRVIGLLEQMGIVDNTGAGGSTRLIVEADEFIRIIDLAHLPSLPPDPIPHVKIVVAGWQLAQEVTG